LENLKGRGHLNEVIDGKIILANYENRLGRCEQGVPHSQQGPVVALVNIVMNFQVP
jgi:hypothetical protein